jgi:molecular chaperone DnaJ
LFERLLGRGRTGPSRGSDVEIALEVPLARIVRGGEEKVHYTRSTPCHACRGTGAEGGTRLHRCQACTGTGRLVQERRGREGASGVVLKSFSRCAACAGTGNVIEQVCASCSGRRVEVRVETLAVNVPVGAEEGMVLRVAAHGEPSDAAGGVPGDLLVVVTTRPDPRFTRAGADLWRSEAVAIPEAVLGGRLRVPTLEGSVEVDVPSATRPGTVQRLRRRGLPRFGGGERGDLLVRIDVRMPEHLGAKQRDLYEQLRALERPERRR